MDALDCRASLDSPPCAAQTRQAVDAPQSMTAIGAPGEVLGGRYRLIRELGRGSKGALYEAEHLRTRRWVALRVLRSDPADGSAETITRFEREARVAERLRHPNVVAVLDRGDDPERGVVFIVHELLAGGDLGQCLQAAGTLAPRVALATLLPVMDALSATHESGVFHRDVKPEDIFLHAGSWGVTPKLRGFGLATVTSLDDDRSVDGREDVLSMGLVLRRCLSTPEAHPTLPADLVAAIERAVEDDRERRWSSMEDFAAALRGCALWQGVDEARSQRWVVNAMGETAEPTPTMGSDVTAQLAAVAPRRGGRWRPMAAMAAMALAGAAALWPGEPAVEPTSARPRAETRATRAERPAEERETAAAAVAVTAAESATTDVGAATARATPGRGARRVNPVIRRGQGLRAPAELGARGFNGAPIIE